MHALAFAHTLRSLVILSCPRQWRSCSVVFVRWFASECSSGRSIWALTMTLIITRPLSVEKWRRIFIWRIHTAAHPAFAWRTEGDVPACTCPPLRCWAVVSGLQVLRAWLTGSLEPGDRILGQTNWNPSSWGELNFDSKSTPLAWRFLPLLL